MPDRPDVAADETATPLASGCPGCAALRGTSRLLADHNLALLDQRREVAARVRLLEAAVAEEHPATIRHHVARLAEMVRS